MTKNLERIGDAESKRRKSKINRLRNRVFHEVYGEPDFGRLYRESPSSYRIGYGIFGLAHYEIDDALYDSAEEELRAIISAS